MCKICLDEEGEMISPCICRGTQRWVHRECLEMWRCRHHPLSPQYRFCMDCRAPYFGNDVPSEVEVFFDGSIRESDDAISMLYVLWFLSMVIINIIWLTMVIFMPSKMYDAKYIPICTTITISSLNSMNPILFKNISNKKVNEFDFTIAFLLFAVSISSVLFNYLISCIVCVFTIMVPVSVQLLSCHQSSGQRTTVIAPTNIV